MNIEEHNRNMEEHNRTEYGALGNSIISKKNKHNSLIPGA